MQEMPYTVTCKLGTNMQILLICHSLDHFPNLIKRHPRPTNINRLIKRHLSHISYLSLYTSFLRLSKEHSQVVIAMIAIFIDCNVDVYFVTLLERTSRRNTVDYALVYRDTD